MLMENCLYHHRTLTLPPFPLSSSPKPHLTRFFTNSPQKLVGASSFCVKRRPIKINASVGPSHCEFSSLNSPLEPRSSVGKYLTGVLQNHPQLFQIVVKDELKLLADDRDAAVARMLISEGSDESVLHRRIAQVKENECQIAIEDVMFLLIFYKFSEIGVPLVPKLSSCVYNGRLEILPSRDFQLESIHSMEVLDIVREYVSTATGLRANSSLQDSWATTKIKLFSLARVYVASILYGYFLKSVLLRYRLERTLSLDNHDLRVGHRHSLSFHDTCPYGSKDLIFGRTNNTQSEWQGLIRKEEEIEDLKCYAMGFSPGSLQRCGKLRSEEAVDLVESHTVALFGNKESGLVENDGVIVTSYSSLKRLVLEAVAFGSFLWETEDYIDSVYKLKDH